MQQDILKLISLIDGAIKGVSLAAEQTQKEISEMLRRELLNFETRNGALVNTQDYAARLARIDKLFSEILGSQTFTEPIREYLNTYRTIEARNISIQRTYSELEVDAEKLSPARKQVYQQAKHYFQGSGLAEAYKQPAKYLLMQQVTGGMTIKDSLKMLDKWDKGELTDGKATMGRQTPNLQRYATQMSRDMMYQYNGNVQEIIKKEYELDAFIYVGDVIKDSRPLCRHLVSLNREIKFAELPELLAAYPQGVIPGTNAANFTVYRGGFSCRHVATPVRSKQINS